VAEAPLDAITDSVQAQETAGAGGAPCCSDVAAHPARCGGVGGDRNPAAQATRRRRQPLAFSTLGLRAREQFEAWQDSSAGTVS
jgi:hypothetical protein